MKIVKTKFLCKNGSQVSPKNYTGKLGTNNKIGFNLKWEDRFIEGKWYDGEYETWSDQLYKLNGGWKRYWVINEMGEKEEISKAHMNAIFETDIQNLRDVKINEILK